MDSTKTIRIIKFIDSKPPNLNQNKSLYSDPYQIISLLGLCLKYYDSDDIYQIIKKNIKRVEKENDNGKIWFR
ncbi:MAG: hypothetical protein Barrevirus14_4 [Barrevirus sp.]|uniref:Uncharacterized protein n=1 Tax=Barrevirus sp. TaxID=2487763 RepID=A0A3G4ZQI2_9VIRU|nr:MAG: hypothetical protein Barrevirus14_4 [Barrevirus sp.]